MAQPDPNDAVRKILETPQASDWLARLTAAFFDAGAKRRVIAEIRDGVAALAPGLGEAELDGLRKAVVSRLVGLASREARPPTPAEAPAVETLTGAALRNAILRSYPYPVALPFRKLEEQESDAGAFGCLLDLFEALLHYLAAVIVSAYFRSGLPSEECNRHLLGSFLKETWSTGDLLALVRETVRLAGDCDGLLPYRELPGYLFVRGKPSPSLLVLESFVTLRNRVWGHGAGRDEEFFAGILPANRDRLVRELALAPWLADWQLLRPTVIDGTGLVSRADLLVGDLREKGCPCALRLQRGDLADNGGDVRAEKSLLLVAPDRQRYLPLFPLSLFRFQLRSQGVYFLQRAQWQKGPGKRQLRRAFYVTYHSGQGGHEEGLGEPAVHSLEKHVHRLEEHLNGAGPAPAPPPEKTAPEPDPDYELPEVRYEQEFHLRTFAGREAPLRQAADWINRPGEGGFLLLVGPPGQGKSALMAELARRERERGGCLLHMVKSQRKPLQFMPALISQAAKLAQVRFGPAAYQGDLDDLRVALLRALTAVQAKTGRAVLLLDALDELAAGASTDFLPPALPPGVKVVLTCRPDIPLLRELRARLNHLEERPLPPLSEADLPLVLDRLKAETGLDLHAAVDCQALFQRLAGNPLFLRRALDRTVQAVRQAGAGDGPPRIDLDALPSTLEALFQDIYNEIAEKQGARFTTPEGRQKARLLQFLCLAREPLSLEQLSELLAQDGSPLALEDCRDRVLEMSQYLLDAGGDCFKPWHQGLADHVRQRLLGSAGCRQVEELFCRWLCRPPRRLGRYGLRHRAAHLLTAERFDELEALFTEPAFLEARVEAGMVFDLVGDLAEALRLLPADRPRYRLLQLLEQALRRDAQYLARHPSGLFQCLWNSCWWYDCPDAAPHLDPPPEGWPPEGPPWERPGPKLAALLEAWRRAKDQATPGFVWLRSLAPPGVPLGSGVASYRGHEAEVLAVACSPDGRAIASGSEDRTVRIWDAHRGNERACLRGHDGAVNGVAYSPDGLRFASASEDGTVRLWDTCAGGLLWCARGHTAGVRCVAFSPDGRLLASGSADQRVRLWDAQTGQERACLHLNRGTVETLAFGPDGRLASGASDRTIALWDPAAGARTSLIGHTSRVCAVAFAPDGRHLVSGSLDRSLVCWDVRTGSQVWHRQERRQVRSVAFAPDGRRLVSGGHTGDIQVWDANGQPLTFVRRAHEGPVYGLAFTPDSRSVVSGGWDHAVHFWNVSGDQAPRRRHALALCRLAVCRVTGCLAVGATSGAVLFWDALRGLEPVPLVRHEGTVRSVAFSPDGRLLASGSRDQTIRVWDLADRQQVACLTAHRGTVMDLAFTPDGCRLVSASSDHTVRIWDVKEPRELDCLSGLQAGLACVAVGPDSQAIAAGTVTGEVGVWDGRGECVWKRLRGHEDRVVAVAFSPDGARLVSRAQDHTTRLWDVVRGECLDVIAGSADVTAVAAGPARTPWWAIVREGETVIESSVTRTAVAWYPTAVHNLTTHLEGRLWVGVHADHLCLFTLEGEPR